jgi:hypothetical protein
MIMSLQRYVRLAVFAAGFSAAFSVHADSSTSSASSLASESSGSVSTSFKGSSTSSSGDNKVADADYRVINLAAVPDQSGMTRVTLQTDDTQHRIVLDLPQRAWDKAELDKGDLVRASNRVYGYEFARSDTRKPFFLVLADNWFNDLAARPVRM